MSDSEYNPLLHWERSVQENLPRVRDSLGMTQTELARRLKEYGLPFHQQTIQRIENGSRPIRLNEAMAMTEVLGVGLDVLARWMPNDTIADLRFSVEKFRRRISEWAEAELSEIGSITELVDDLTGSALFRLESAGDEDPVARWSIAAAITAHQLFDALGQAIDGLLRAAGGGDSSRDPHTGQLLPFMPESRDEIGSWMVRYGSSDWLAELLAAGAESLFGTFPSRSQDDD